ncbi:thioredoxin family protein [Sulfurimonas sp.]
MFSSKVVSIFSVVILIIVFIFWKLFLQGIDQSVQKDIESGSKVVLLFSANWCSTCKEEEPIYKEVKKEFPDIHFYEVASNLKKVEQKLLFKQYKLHGIPTFILFKNAHEVSRFSGLQTKESLKEKFSRL